MSGDDRVSTIRGCFLLLLLYFVGAVISGLIFGLAVVGAAWLLGWI
jgi:hypothetical protein